MSTCRGVSPRTIVVKILGLTLVVPAGLSLGKEGPLVHLACCWAALLLALLYRNRENGKNLPRLEEGINKLHQVDEQIREQHSPAAAGEVQVGGCEQRADRKEGEEK